MVHHDSDEFKEALWVRNNCMNVIEKGVFDRWEVDFVDFDLKIGGWAIVLGDRFGLVIIIVYGVSEIAVVLTNLVKGYGVIWEDVSVV